VLIPADTQTAEAVAALAAADGTAWLSPRRGEYRLVWSGGSKEIRVEPAPPGGKPGYASVMRVSTH
jgi:hypothetical protein